MQLTHVYRESEMKEIKQLYESAFPANEKKPFSFIREKNDEGSMEILSITGEGGEFLGLAMFILHEDLALLDYFAIAPSVRGHGIGTEALALLRQRHAGRRFLLEIEDTDEENAPNMAERVRRKAFYLRNGLQVMPYRVLLFGVRMQILTDASPVSFAEYHAIFPAVISEKAAKNVILYTEA